MGHMGHMGGMGHMGHRGPMGAMGSTTPSAPAAANHVTIAGFAFSPSTVTVGKGTTVTWTNNDQAPHTVTGSGGLNSPTLGRGATYSFTFKSTGTFSYICTIHPSMHGTVVVK